MIESPKPQPLAPFACDPAVSRGRLVEEAESAMRSRFQRDRDRVIHCGAFRRLKYKTQVFVYHEGDYYRTRLTHSIEVSQIARSICRTLGLNEDLTEALALAHDLGHTCFGHAGEEALDQAMEPFGGFDHNEQTFRVVTQLEHRYAEFDGLNLTWESLEGLVKHNGPVPRPPATIAAFDRGFSLALASQPSAEAQVAALSDDIAYTTHDIDDGLRADLFAIDDLAPVPLIGPIFAEVRALYPGLERSRMIYEAVRRLINSMVTDLLGESTRRLRQVLPDSVEALRDCGRPMIAFSDSLLAELEGLRGFLFQRMYRHPKVTSVTEEAKEVVRALFTHYLERPAALPDEWRVSTEGLSQHHSARTVADYIAGMTDRYALQDYERIFQKRVIH